MRLLIPLMIPRSAPPIARSA